MGLLMQTCAQPWKAMAIIMDERGDYRDIDEVLVIVGPTLDIMIKMDYDDDR